MENKLTSTPATRRTFVCSQLRGDYATNVTRTQEYVQHALSEGLSPYAPHLYLPAILDDSIEAEREAGILCGLDFLESCSGIRVYTVGGIISAGMRCEIEHAAMWAIPRKFFAVEWTWTKDGTYMPKYTELSHLENYEGAGLACVPSQQDLLGAAEYAARAQAQFEIVAQALRDGAPYESSALDVVLGVMPDRNLELEEEFHAAHSGKD